jgi:hypothetical protein
MTPEPGKRLGGHLKGDNAAQLLGTKETLGLTEATLSAHTDQASVVDTARFPR